MYKEQIFDNLSSKINRKKIYNLCGSVFRWSKLMLVQIVISGGEVRPQ